MNMTDIISAKQASTLYGLFKERLKRSPHKTAYKSYNSETKQWFDITWSEVASRVATWQNSLIKEEL